MNSCATQHAHAAYITRVTYLEVDGLIGEEAIPNKGQGENVILNSNCCGVNHRGVRLDVQPAVVVAAASRGLIWNNQDVEGEA